jgi:hypothetical protein
MQPFVPLSSQMWGENFCTWAPSKSNFPSLLALHPNDGKIEYLLSFPPLTFFPLSFFYSKQPLNYFTKTKNLIKPKLKRQFRYPQILVQMIEISKLLMLNWSSRFNFFILYVWVSNKVQIKVGDPYNIPIMGNNHF